MSPGVSGGLSREQPEGGFVSGSVLEGPVSHRRDPTVTQPAPLLTLDDVASRLSVSLRVVEGLVATKALPAVRIGPERRVRPEVLQVFILASER